MRNEWFYWKLRKSTLRKIWMPLLFWCLLIQSVDGAGNPAYAGSRLSVDVPVANIRSRPTKKSDLLWKVEKYYPIKIIKKKGNWYHFVDFENDKGWIHNSLVKKTPTVIINVPEGNIRSGPGTKNPILFTAEKGVPFKIIKKKGNWYHIVHQNNDKGWIHKKIVW